MNMSQLIESKLNPDLAIIDEICAAGEPWVKIVKRGQIFRIVDLEGNQAVDTLFFNANHALERYSVTDTIRAQNKLYLTTGSKLCSNLGNAMLTIIADTCGRHDTLGGACAAKAIRYATRWKNIRCTVAGIASFMRWRTKLLVSTWA